MSRLLLALAAATVFVPPAGSAPKLKEKPLSDRLLGDWVLETETQRGTTTKVTGLETRWAFTEDGRWLQYRGDKIGAEGRFTADPAGDPATLDLQQIDASGTKYLCLFKIDGDRLTIGSGGPRADRPKTFDAPGGTQRTVFVFRRAKRE